VIERLFDLPLDEFVPARDAAARELRQAGRRTEADTVKALRKPTAAAAAVNRLVREHRDELEQFLAAAAVLRDAQVRGKGDLGAAGAREREALARLVAAGGDQVRQTLQAAAVDDDAAEELRAGRLVRELEPRGFGSLLLEAPAAPPRAARAKADQRRAVDDAQEKLREAKRTFAAAEAAERDARREWDARAAELRLAADAVEAAAAELERRRRPR